MQSERSMDGILGATVDLRGISRMSMTRGISGMICPGSLDSSKTAT